MSFVNKTILITSDSVLRLGRTFRFANYFWHSWTISSSGNRKCNQFKQVIFHFHCKTFDSLEKIKWNLITAILIGFIFIISFYDWFLSQWYWINHKLVDYTVITILHATDEVHGVAFAYSYMYIYFELEFDVERNWLLMRKFPVAAAFVNCIVFAKVASS